MSAVQNDASSGNAMTSSTVATIDLTEHFTLGDWRIEPALRRACSGDTVVKIDPRNMRVLQILAERQGKIVPLREIEALAWEGLIVTPDSLYQSIRQLRQALGDTKSPAKYIETVARKGYRLVANVTSSRIADSTPVREMQLPLAHGPGNPTGARHVNWNFRHVLRKPKFSTGAAVVVCLTVGVIGFARLSILPRTTVAQPSNVGPDVPSRLEIGATEVEAGRALAGDVRALRALGALALRRGRPIEAVEYFERALERQIAKSGERNELVADVLSELANAQFWLEEEGAHKTATRAMSILDQIAPQDATERIYALKTLAEILTGLGEYSDSDRLINDALALARKHYREGHENTLGTRIAQSVLWYAQGRLTDAEIAARAVLKLTIQTRGADDLRTAQLHTMLSAILIDCGRFAEGEQEARSSINILDRIADGEHPYALSSKHLLGEALMGQGWYAEAEALLREELSALNRAASEGWRIGRAAGALGEVLLRRGQIEEAEHYLSLAKEKLTRTKGWPIERENRKMQARLQQLSAARSKSPSVAKL